MHSESSEITRPIAASAETTATATTAASSIIATDSISDTESVSVKTMVMKIVPLVLTSLFPIWYLSLRFDPAHSPVENTHTHIHTHSHTLNQP